MTRPMKQEAEQSAGYAMYGEFKHPGNVVPVRKKTPWWERIKRALAEAWR